MTKDKKDIRPNPVDNGYEGDYDEFDSIGGEILEWMKSVFRNLFLLSKQNKK